MKSILIYYSYGGNTRHVAEKVVAEIGADLAEIETVKPYTGSYDHVVDQGQKEVNSGFQPKIGQINTDLSKYHTVILGTPVWWYTFAPAMNSFLHSVDLSEKSVYPFATNGGLHSRILRMPARVQRFMRDSMYALMKKNRLLLITKFKSGRNRL